jgi:DNA repair protein RadC
MQAIYEAQTILKKVKEPSVKLTCSQQARNLLFELWDKDLLYTKESFYCLHLNRNNYVLSVDLVGIGGMTGAIADGKNLFRTAICQGATSVILAHNHPSMNPRPSESDIRLTKNLSKFGAMIEIKVLDHIILAGEKSYTSLSDEGLF